MSDLIGQTIRGYEIIEKIGAGGYGAVYKAHEVSVSRDVAIKIILPEHAAKPEFAQRFETEARLVAQLEHPHIVPLYAYWRDDSGAFLVMRYVKGGNLAEVLETQGAISLTQTLRLLNHISEALTVAHQASIVHRDLKPDNILLDERGNAYLTDFGIAKDTSSDINLTATDSIVGTIAYLSPEQIEGKALTPQSDIYALGIMLYEMLAGEHPFISTVPTMIIMKHLQEPVPPITEKRPDLPDEIDDAIQKTTAKDNVERFSDVAAVELAFNKAANTMSSSPIAIPHITKTTHKLTIIHKPKTPSTPDARNRFAMLQNVCKFWVEGVLENSLHGMTLIELGMKHQANSVKHSWNTLLRRRGTPDETLPHGTQIVDIFDKLNGKLLILGDPGSGKTTTMLELTRDLLYRAELDNEHPMPVVFNLSSWSEYRKPLPGWLVDELVTKYQAPKKIAQEWVEKDALLLLLDGLDEVANEYRDDCIQTINDYREEHGFVDIVVCSRTLDYEALTNQLMLNGAIVLQPLDDKQIDTYLDDLGPEMEAVYQRLDKDKTLREMSRSPLMLSVIVLVYRGISGGKLPHFTTPEAQRQHLFATYVQHMFERHSGNTHYAQEQIVHYLSWLAQMMVTHAQSVFLIEKMQISWLSAPQQHEFHKNVRLIHVPTTAMIYGLPCLLIPAATDIPSWLFASLLIVTGVVVAWVYTGAKWQALPQRSIIALTYMLSYGLSVGVGFGIATGLGIGIAVAIYVMLLLSFVNRFLNQIGAAKDYIANVEKLRFSRTRINFWIGIGAASIGAVTTIGIRLLLGPESVAERHLFWGMVGGGCIVGLFFLFLSGLTNNEVERRTRPNQGVWHSLTNACRAWGAVILVFFLFCLLAITPVTSLAVGFGFWLALLGSNGYPIFYTYGGYAVIQHVSLRRVLLSKGVIPEDYARFLDHAASLIILRKVGGGYMFIHRYLLEYFAELETGEN
jgi:serine/threonine protein kinase